MKDWMQSLPAWLEVREVDPSLFAPLLPLHDGEREAFALAISLNADILLIDEKNGRREAKRIGQVVIPTLALLEMASQRGFIDLPNVIERLSKTTFHASRRLLEEIIERDRKRKERSLS